jgi:hypothetical protein
MNYEEKYKKALSFLKDLKPHMSDYCIEKLEGFFHELKEGEDEKIAKELIRYLPYCDDIAKDTKERWISWLEKQGEQKQSSDSYLKGYDDGLRVNIKMQDDKPAWSEEDEKMKSLIISTLTSMGTLNLERYHQMNLDEVKKWFKSLKERV